MGIKKQQIAIISFFLLFETFNYGQKEDTLLYKLEQLEEQGLYNNITTYGSIKRKMSPEYYALLGRAYGNLNKEDSSFHFFKLAKYIYSTNGKSLKVAEINLAIANLLESQNNFEEDQSYFEEFWEYANKSNDTLLLAKGYNHLGRINFMDKDPQIPLEHFNKAHTFFGQIGNSKMAITNLMNVGVVYSNRLKDNDSARIQYFKALDLLKQNRGYLENKNLYHDLLNNIGNSYRRSKEYQKALKYYKQAETLAIQKYYTKTKKILFGNMNATYYYLGDYENAYNYLYKYDSIKDQIDLSNQNTAISEIQEKYDNEKLRADNLENEAKRRQNRNWLIVALLALVIGTGIAILLQKNTTKKRLLAEQEALLKQERVDNLLKAQELVSIDAMIAGQEKERQRVANELHDDLGSLMATIKLHFDNANSNTKDPALQNAQRLLEEAYQKVRGMAHSKNSGVMSDQGLLPAIKKMAQVISETNALEVTVEDFGMGERLENSLELNLFRMVQELVANAIKHAEATKVGIQLTQHEDNLNIIIEDNGQGFDRSKVIADQTGMGLTTIEKRVEHLEGHFTVDSVLGRGTSILIDIPV